MNLRNMLLILARVAPAWFYRRLLRRLRQIACVARFRRGSHVWQSQNRQITLAPVELPTHLNIEITERCNLNCNMCPRRYTVTTNREMGFEQYERLLTAMPSIRRVTFVGKGETLMHREIGRMLDLHRDRNLTTSIITNGFLLTPPLLDKLVPGSQVLVSIDSPVPEQYRAIRGGDLKSLAQTVTKATQHRWTDLSWGINFMVMEENLDAIPAMIDFTASVGCTALYLLLPIPFDKELEKRHPFHDMEKYRLALRAAKQRALRQAITLSYTDGAGFCSSKCTEPWHTLRIAIDGAIYPCCYVFESVDNAFLIHRKQQEYVVPQENYKMGNSFGEQSIRDIWLGHKYQALRNSVAGFENADHTDFEALLRLYQNDHSGFRHCNICMWRWGIHC